MVDTQTLLTVICSGGFLAFVQFLINRFDSKHDRLNELDKKITDGLNLREKTGKSRYDEHRLAIEQMNIDHQKDFQKLQEAIQQLVNNDTKFAQGIEKLVEKQDIVASANVGMVHNTLIRFTDPIIERNAVTYEELATLDSLFVPYHKLGGNGECKRRYEDVNKLTKISREEAIKRDREVETEKFKKMQETIGTR